MSDPTDAAPLVTAIQRVAEMPLALDVSADLTVTVDGHELRVEAYTDRVFVDFPSLRAAVDVLRSVPGSSGGQRPGAGGSLPATLAAADLTAVARVDAREVATLGADADGPLRHLGYDNVAVSPRGILLVWLGL